MMKYGVTKELFENHRVLFDPYMHKACQTLWSPELSMYAKDTAFEVALV